MPNYPNKGILFNNKYKTSDNHPDFTGKGNFDGTNVTIAGWWNYKEGKPPFMTLAFTPDETTESQEEKPTPEFPEDLDDDLPF